MLPRVSKLILELEKLGFKNEINKIKATLNKEAGNPLSIPVGELLELSQSASKHIVMTSITTGLSPIKFLRWAATRTESQLSDYSFDTAVIGADVKGVRFPLVVQIFISNDEDRVSGMLLGDVPMEELPPDLRLLWSGTYDEAKVIFVKINPASFIPPEQRVAHSVEALPFNQQLEMFDSMLTNFIYEILVHEVTHSVDILLSKDSPSIERYKKLYKDEDRGFYYSTREELKAYLNEIIETIIPIILYDKEEFLNMGFLEYLKKYSNLLNLILTELEEGPEDSKTPSIQGTLAQRKERAKKYLLSSLYTWWINTKERVKEL